MNDDTKQQLQSNVFERLIQHLRERKDVQNIDLMNLAGFCRNCISKWYREEAQKKGVDISDPDFILKLWNNGVRIFKVLSKFRVYHFGSITTRKNKNINLNKGSKIFLKKWGFTYKFFRKYYLDYQNEYLGPLNEPKKNFFFYFELYICKLRLITNIIKNKLSTNKNLY